MAAASIWAATAVAIAGTRGVRPTATGGTTDGSATATGRTAVRGTTAIGAAPAAAMALMVRARLAVREAAGNVAVQPSIADPGGSPDRAAGVLPRRYRDARIFGAPIPGRQ